MNMGEVNEIAVTSASGIIVTAREQAEHAHGAGQRAQRVRLQVRRLEQMQLVRMPAQQGQQRNGNHAAHEDGLPDGNGRPEQLHAQRHSGEQHDGDEFQRDAQDGAM